MRERSRAPSTGGAALEVVVAPEPFRRRVERLTIAPGANVAEILFAACMAGVLDPEDLGRTEVDIDGVRVEDRDAITEIVPAPGQVVNLTVQVYGGRGGNKALQTVLQVAIMVAAFAVAGPAGNAASFMVDGLGSATAAGAAAGVAAQVAAVSAVTLAGTALISALNPSQASPAQTYSLETQSNQSRLRQPMPLCLDSRRWAFDLASSAFTSFSGDDMWITAIYALHYGPCTLTDVKIGETLLTAYPAGEVLTETFLVPGPRNSRLYPTDIHQDSFENTLDREHGDYALATTVDDATTIELDFFWASGLYFPKSDGRIVTSDTKLFVEISPYGKNTWQPAPGLPAGTDKSGNHYGAGCYYVTASSKDPVRKTLTIALPSQGQWDVRLHRDTRPVDDTNNDTVTWTAMRTPRPGKPVLDETLSILVLKVKAAQDFSGTLGVVSGVVTPIVPVPGADGSWSTTSPSSNAAALARWLMTGPAAALPLTADEIDASCAEQYALIEANGWQGGALVTDGSQQDALNKLASAGRFSVFWSGSALVFSPDWIKDAPRQLFVGRNAQNYQRTRTYPDPVHAVWVEFINSAEDWEQDGLFVYADGYDATNATLIESYSLDFSCTPERAHKEGRVWLAKRELQVWTHQWTAFVDGVAASRGDRVRARRSSAMYGMVDARVAFRRWQGALVSGVRLDAAVTMQAGKSYALDVRRADGLVLNLPLATTPGKVREIAFAAPVPVAGAPEKGDLVAFGAVGQVTEDLEIVDLDPRSDGTVTITAANYIGPDLQAAETGAIPPLTTFLSARVAAPTPRILSTAGSPDGVAVAFDVDPQRTAPLKGFVARWRLTPTDDNASSWSTLPLIPPGQRSFKTPAISGTQHQAGDSDGEVRVDVELWSVLTTGEASPAATANGVLVIQGVLPVTGLTVTGEVRRAADGSSYPVLYVAADAVLSGAVQDLVVERQPTGSDPEAWVSAGQPLPAANPVGDYPGVAGGATYDVRARWRDSDGWLSDWEIVPAVAVPPGGLVATDTTSLGGTPAPEIIAALAAIKDLSPDGLAALNAAIAAGLGANDDDFAASITRIALMLRQTQDLLDARTFLDGLPVGQQVTITRQTVDGLAETITVVSSKTDQTAAGLSSEIIARTSADSAEASRVDDFVAATGDNFAAVTQSVSAASSQIGAIASSLTNYEAATNQNLALVQQSISAVTGTGSASATSITTLAAQVGADEALALQRYTAQATTNGATASLLNLLGVASPDGTSFYINSNVVQTAPGVTLASALSGVQSISGDASAAVANEAQTRASADSAFAQQLSTVSSTVGGHTSSITFLEQAVDGLQAQVLLEVGVDGYVTGLSIDGQTRTFAVRADNIVLGAGLTPVMVISGGKVRFSTDVEIDGALLLANSAGTAAIRVGAVTESHFIDDHRTDSLIGNAVQCTSFTLDCGDGYDVDVPYRLEAVNSGTSSEVIFIGLWIDGQGPNDRAGGRCANGGQVETMAGWLAAPGMSGVHAFEIRAYVQDTSYAGPCRLNRTVAFPELRKR